MPSLNPKGHRLVKYINVNCSVRLPGCQYGILQHTDIANVYTRGLLHIRTYTLHAGTVISSAFVGYLVFVLSENVHPYI